MAHQFTNEPNLKQITLRVLRSLVGLLERDEVLVKSICPINEVGEHGMVEHDLTVTVGFTAPAEAIRDELAMSDEGPKLGESRLA